jgi:hypothetical protein
MSSVRIIECRDKEDPGSEGRFVKHMLDLMGITNDYRTARNKAEFIDLLSSIPVKTDVIHVATHGRSRKTRDGKDKFTGFWTPDEEHVTIKDIKAADIDLSGKTVLSTACFSGQKAPGEAFKEATDCKHYIAPIRDPKFYNAALMCHIFYHKHLTLTRSVKKAFSEYEGRYYNPHKFRFF